MVSLFEEKSMFRSQYIKIIFVLINPQISKFMTSLYTLLKIGNFTVDCFFRTLGSTKMKFCQIIEQLMTKIED